jgi:hypothetical protein
MKHEIDLILVELLNDNELGAIGSLTIVLNGNLLYSAVSSDLTDKERMLVSERDCKIILHHIQTAIGEINVQQKIH